MTVYTGYSGIGYVCVIERKGGARKRGQIEGLKGRIELATPPTLVDKGSLTPHYYFGPYFIVLTASCCHLQLLSPIAIVATIAARYGYCRQMWSF
jgi:hypothetical protein